MKCQLLATDVSGFAQTIRRKVLNMRFIAQIVLLLAIATGSSVGALAQRPESTAPYSDAPKGNAILVNLSQPIYPPLAHQRLHQAQEQQ